ncbi:hypothetical protein KFL_003800070 [Klebsormidium nitens]|uniref:Uncharacterized protein n=1 Tax=Klebsormidium nitens TaxID=105231 RepID=A0A1Y1IFH0_KLENI|nr:hypothetical protein KFL_003800070 [Klebsormidium nitens]|eukprot:GAQ87831.1 hypothetical protein KFL_003800070 [Klebsormidium nitens]
MLRIRSGATRQSTRTAARKGHLKVFARAREDEKGAEDEFLPPSRFMRKLRESRVGKRQKDGSGIEDGMGGRGRWCTGTGTDEAEWNDEKRGEEKGGGEEK